MACKARPLIRASSHTGSSRSACRRSPFGSPTTSVSLDLEVSPAFCVTDRRTVTSSREAHQRLLPTPLKSSSRRRLRPRVQHAPRLGRSSAGLGERTEDLDACVDASQLHEAARDDEVDIGILALLFRTCASQPGTSRRAFPLELLSSMLEPTGLLPTVGRPVRRPLSAKQARHQILHTFVQHACRSSASVKDASVLECMRASPRVRLRASSRNVVP